jgi:hypothetical protein
MAFTIISRSLDNVFIEVINAFIIEKTIYTAPTNPHPPPNLPLEEGGT